MYGTVLCRSASAGFRVVASIHSLFPIVHAVDGYMRHAFPLDELDPIHCRGRTADPDRRNINVNDALGNYSLTLIDSLDTLALMGNKTAFWSGVTDVIRKCLRV